MSHIQWKISLLKLDEVEFLILITFMVSLMRHYQPDSSEQPHTNTHTKMCTVTHCMHRVVGSSPHQIRSQSFISYGLHDVITTGRGHRDGMWGSMAFDLIGKTPSVHVNAAVGREIEQLRDDQQSSAQCQGHFSVLFACCGKHRKDKSPWNENIFLLLVSLSICITCESIT